MPSSNVVLLTIAGCGLVTWLSRILPLVLLKHFTLPKPVIEYLAFVPIVIMATLWFSSLFTANPGHLPQLNLDYALASLPTVVAAVISKSLLVIVAVGIISLAGLRILGIA
ncbi:AzlD domain-containing protein [Lacticaseibacillus saniviri]|uniref:AzlD domain-containing protein n=1 Tax=Lacticaseibacillus saniviri TaxID=931533 RepID=UPI0006CF61CF|nr:AzlD domain-containing protein [Lacticaseibacillus saniviri]MCG4280795.1 AzlD domain-containing protein [Lacticaseibacillus saniviri]